MQRILMNLWKYFSVILILTLAIVACDGNGGDSESIGSGPGFVSPRGIAVEADGSLVVTDLGLVAVVRVDQVSGRPHDHIGCQHRQWPVKQLAPARSNR